MSAVDGRMTGPKLTPLPKINDARLATLFLAAQAYSHLHGLAYARLTRELTIEYASPNLGALVSEPERGVEGRVLSEALPEFIGLEAAIAEVLHRRAPEVRLERVNRMGAGGATLYYDFHLVPLEAPEDGLLVIIEDVTLVGQLEQLVQQAHNDLKLLQREVAQAHHQLRELRGDKPPA
jgi:hypothetical protein